MFYHFINHLLGGNTINGNGNWLSGII